MRVRYYVLSRDQQFEVYRESTRKGSYPFRSRAVDAARTMARLEARLARTPTEVQIDDERGELRVDTVYEGGGVRRELTAHG